MFQFDVKKAHTPIVLQMETVDCGAAALAIILSYYGCSLPLEAISTQCLVSREGVSIGNLAKAANHFGMDVSVYEQISSAIKLPAIIFWNRKHYVVLEGIKKNKFYINDPQQGKYIVDCNTFQQKFSNRVIHLQPNAQFKKNKLNLWQREVLPLFKSQWSSLGRLIAGLFVLSLLQLSPLVFTKCFIDNRLSSTENTSLLMLMLSVFGVQFILSYQTRKWFRLLETRFATELSTKLIAHLVHLPLRFFNFRRSADLLYRVQAVDRLVAEPWAAACSFASALLQGCCSLLFLCTYSYRLAVMALLTYLVGFFIMSFLKEPCRQVEHAMKMRLRDLGVLTAGYLSSLMAIKIQGSELRYRAKWQELLTQYIHHHEQNAYQQEKTHLGFALVFSMSYSALLISGLYMVCLNKMTLGELMACQVLLLSFNESLMQNNKLFARRESIESDLHCLADITHHPKYLVTQDSKLDAEGPIELVNLTFGYSHEFKPLLDGLNVSIPSGSHVALVGASGCGKSTLVHLFSGLYEPWSGSILINGIPLSHYSLAERARCIGVVGQQQFFYQGSLRENLCLWRDYSIDELMYVLKMACMDELINQTEEGLDYQLTEGATNLSGGQRQRLELARTLLARPKILILDEATSALDPIIEKQIQKNLTEYAATKIVIAHRVDTIQDAECVYVLEKGQLVSRSLDERALHDGVPCH